MGWFENLILALPPPVGPILTASFPIVAIVAGAGAIATARRRWRARTLVLGAIAALALVATVMWALVMASPTPNPRLGISNGTTLRVTLVVNERAVVEIPPGGPAPTINVADLPALPWSVEARSPSGRVLTSMRVEPGQVGSMAAPNGGTAYSGTFGRVDLTCGRLTIWAGDFQPSGPPPAASPGTAGDCVR